MKYRQKMLKYWPFLFTQVKTWAELLNTFCSTGKLELELIYKVQMQCYEDAKLMKLFPEIVRSLYDQDVLAEDTILFWFRKGTNPKGRYACHLCIDHCSNFCSYRAILDWSLFCYLWIRLCICTWLCNCVNGNITGRASWRHWNLLWIGWKRLKKRSESYRWKVIYGVAFHWNPSNIIIYFLRCNSELLLPF